MTDACVARSGAVQAKLLLLAPVAGVPPDAVHVPLVLPVNVTSSPTATVVRVASGLPGAVSVVADVIFGVERNGTNGQRATERVPSRGAPSPSSSSSSSSSCRTTGAFTGASSMLGSGFFTPLRSAAARASDRLSSSSSGTPVGADTAAEGCGGRSTPTPAFPADRCSASMCSTSGGACAGASGANEVVLRRLTPRELGCVHAPNISGGGAQVKRRRAAERVRF